MSEAEDEVDISAADQQVVARGRLRWWREVLYVGAFYLIYSWTRNRFGSASVDTQAALDNARQIIDLERAIGLFHEESIQEFFLDNERFIQFWNIFYGTFHFAVTAFALIYTYLRSPRRYPLWRNTLGFTTALALIGFSLYPLMPPRLLDAGPPFGGGQSFGFVDTLVQYGGLWSFESGAVSKVSNQFAAMPSLHFAWSLWCCLVLYPQMRNRVGKVLVLAYPWCTLFAVIVTGNHYWIDAVGGALTLGLGYALARPFTAYIERRQEQREQALAA